MQGSSQFSYHIGRRDDTVIPKKRNVKSLLKEKLQKKLEEELQDDTEELQDVNLQDDTGSSDEVDSNEAKWPKFRPKPDSIFKNILIAEVIVFCALLCIGLLIGIIAASGGNLIDF